MPAFNHQRVKVLRELGVWFMIRGFLSKQRTIDLSLTLSILLKRISNLLIIYLLSKSHPTTISILSAIKQWLEYCNTMMKDRVNLAASLGIN